MATAEADGSTATQLFKKAQNFEQKKLWLEAEEVYRQALQMNSNLQEYIHFNLAQLLLNKNDYPQARHHFEKVLELSPNIKLQIDSQFNLAKISLTEKKYDQARKYLKPLEKRLRREEIYPQILWSYASAEKAMRNQALFCKLIRKVYSKFPDFAPTQSWGLDLEKNQFEFTSTGCKASLEDQKIRIKNLLWAGASGKVKRELDDLKNKNKFDQYELQRLEVYYLLHEGDVAQALKILTPLYNERKNDFSYLMTIGSVAARAGEYQAAVGSLYRASKLAGKSKKSREALYQSAFLSYQFQDYDGARKRFREFIKLHPKSGLSRDAQWHLAWIQYLKGDYSGAFTSFQNLKKNAGRSGGKKSSIERINYWMAMSLFKQKKFAESRDLFTQLAKDPLLGYYSQAAQFRIRKINELVAENPKSKELEVVKVASQFVPRYSVAERLLPSDDLFDAVILSPEARESEESIITTLVGDEGESAEEAVVEDAAESVESQVSLDRPPVVVDEDSEQTPQSSFSSPILSQRFERAKELVNLGLLDWAKWDLYDIERKTSNREYLKKLMSEYEAVSNYHRSSYIGQVYFGKQRADLGIEQARGIWESTFPKAYAQFVLKYSKQFDIPSELVWAIMRAESQYKKDVISPVGALGLMQVMPSTGRRIASMLNESDFQPSQLLEPDTGIRIGARYLQRLMKKFEGAVPLVAAGYNAGPHRVKTWLSSFGFLELDEFIEHIPFLETRNYVKKVVANYQTYNYLYGKKTESLASLSEVNQVRFSESVFTKETWEEL